MTRLAFLSPALADPAVAVVSPLRHALAPGIDDVSHLGKLELRGAIDGVVAGQGESLIRLSPRRALLVSEGPAMETASRVAGPGIRTYDVTAALAAFEIEGEQLLRRLTALDLSQLPTVGSIARGTRAVIERREGERFRLFVAQELGHYVVEVVLDTLKGLASR